MISTNAPVRAPTGPISVGFRRAFYSPAATEPGLADDNADNSAQLYIPTGIDSLRNVLRWPPSRARLVAWLESDDAQLLGFQMTFDTVESLDREGRRALRYDFRYATPRLGPAGAAIHLRFSDRDLHGLFFRRAGPVPIGAGGAAPTVLSATLPLERNGRIVERTARLQVLLPDLRTVVASIPINYSAPAR
ncbi:MAG TPA: hypothetical protein VF603_14705 [Allosphingosinicella sp.]